MASAPPTPSPARTAPADAPGIPPELIVALQRAVEDLDTDAEIRVRIVSSDDCGPTAAPGSDCLVGRAIAEVD